MARLGAPLEAERNAALADAEKVQLLYNELQRKIEPFKVCDTL